MPKLFREIERRSDKRLDLSLPIKLLGHKAKSKNISSSGVYLEVETDVAKLFSPGKKITLGINANIYTPWLPSKTVRFTTRGVILRTNTVEGTEHDSEKRTKRLEIALNFIERFKVMYKDHNHMNDLKSTPCFNALKDFLKA
ncbi:MAG: PilZ domain-containing protein [Candidatus Scalinduaceae bacterium]